jgi:hypothetical protein
LRFLGIILRVLRLEVSIYNVYITNQFLTTFAHWGHWGREGVKSVSRTVNIKEENFVPVASKNSASGFVHLAFMSVKPTHTHMQDVKS